MEKMTGSRTLLHLSGLVSHLCSHSCTFKRSQHRGRCEFLETNGRLSITSWNHGLEPLTFFLKEITFPMVSFTALFSSPSLSPGLLLTLHSCLHNQTPDKFFPPWNMQSESLSLDSKVWWSRTHTPGPGFRCCPNALP